MFLRRALALAICLSSPAFAIQLGDPDDLLSLEVHSFVSQGFIYTTHQNNYLAKSNRGSLEFTEIGVNFTKQLTESLRLGFQLFSRDLGPIGNYTVKADWFYLDYRFTDWFGIRAGRVKLPFGLYNDTSDIDSVRTAVLLPPSVYPAQVRDYLLAQTGVEVYGRFDLGKGGALDYRLYGGTVFIDLATDRLPGVSYDLSNFNIPYMVGGRVLYETPLDGLRLGVSYQASRLEGTLSTRSEPVLSSSYGNDSRQWVASVEYAAHDLLVALEYSQWRTNSKAVDPAVFAGSNTVSERAYALISYRASKHFQPGLYYSLFYPNLSVRKGRADEQHDLCATFRFDLNEYWLVKVEGHLMIGTAGLSPVLNDNRALSTLAPVWGAFFVKTTARF